MAADLATQLAVERLLARYVASIDADRLEEWPGYFTERCRYQIIPRENCDKKLPIGIFFADSRGMLQDRVASLREERKALQAELFVMQPPTFSLVKVEHLVRDEGVAGSNPATPTST